jgi:Family of unknown function (DUF6326)
MKTTNKTTGMKDRKVILSTLWIFATLNYLYCDVVGLMNPDVLRQYLTGSVNGIHTTSSSAFLKLGVLRLLCGMHGRGLTLKVECELVQIQGY